MLYWYTGHYCYSMYSAVYRAKFSYTNYAGQFTVCSGELSPGERRHDTFSTHKASSKSKYSLPMNMNFNRPRAARMGPARGASTTSIEEGSYDNEDDTNNNVSNAFPGGERSVLQALGQRWRALLGAATVSSSGSAKRRSSLKPFLSNSGDSPQSSAAAVGPRSARVLMQEHPRMHSSSGISARSSGSAKAFTALVPLSPVVAVAPAATLAAPVLEPSSTLHNVMVEGHVTSSDLQTHLAPLLARLFIEEQRKMRAARSGATATAAATAAAGELEPADCYSSKNTVIVVSGPPGFSDQVDALLRALAVPTHMVLFLD
jgi:hypothetical protein